MTSATAPRSLLGRPLASGSADEHPRPGGAQGDPLGGRPPRAASSASLRLAVLHFAAPGPRLLAAALDQLLEPLEISAHLRLHNPEEIAGDILDARLTLDVHLDVDACLLVTDWLERDGAVVLDLTVDRPPSDLLVWSLLRDLGRPLTGLAPNLGHPLHMTVVELLDRLDPFHELRKLFELSPLVVGLLNRNLDVDRIINFRHLTPPLAYVLSDHTSPLSVTANFVPCGEARLCPERNFNDGRPRRLIGGRALEQPRSQHRGDLADSAGASQTGFSHLLLDDDECRESFDPKALKKLGPLIRVDRDELDFQVVAPLLEGSSSRGAGLSTGKPRRQDGNESRPTGRTSS
jgi:hypothetical protein